MMEEILKNTKDTDLIDKNLKNFIPFKPLDKDKQGGDQ
jgi:hypothetical protein